MVEVEHDAPPDPEAQLGIYAATLAAAVDAALVGWVRRCVEGVAVAQGVLLDDAATAALTAAGERARTEVGAAVADLLTADLDEQRTTPLTILRAAVSYPTDVLLGLGATPVERDDFARRAFPEDLFGLSPASFADVDPALQDPGIAWGAAKAFVHRQRRLRRGDA